MAWPFTRRLPAIPEQVEVRTATVPDAITPPDRVATMHASVTAAQALTVPAIFRGVQLIQSLVAQMEPQVWRGGQVIGSPLLVVQPEIGVPRQRTIRRTVHSLVTTGNAYWRIYRNDKGLVSNVEVLNPQAMAVSQDTAGALVYDYAGYFGGKPVRVTAADLAHLKFLDVPGSLTGLGPLQAARQTVFGILALESFSQNVFAESGVPTGVLTTEQILDPTLAADYLDSWETAQARRKTAVLGSGLSYEGIVDATALQMLEARKYAAVEVARLLGIPAHLLAAELGGSSLTYATLQDYRADLITTTLSLYTSEIAAAWSALLPRGQEVRFATGTVAGVVADTETPTPSDTPTPEEGAA